MTKEEAVKALPIRLVHGGNYGEWAKDAGVADAGASSGAGLRRITKLARQLCIARKQLVAEMRRREPAWTEAALQRARLKKAKGMPIAAMVPWRRERLEQQAEGSVFAIVLQDIEDGCLVLAVSSLAACGWRTHSLQQDGALAEQGRCVDGGPRIATPRVERRRRARDGRARNPRGHGVEDAHDREEPAG